MDFSFIIVNHKSDKHITSCIDSIRKNACKHSFEIIIVQNDNQNPTLKETDNLIFLELSENKGFGNACNIGAKCAMGEIIFFINPDAKLLDDNLHILQNRLANQNIGIIAPQIITCDGFPEKWSVGYDVTPISILKNNLGFSKDKYLSKSTKEISTGWVSGCAFAIKNSLFKEIKGFNEDYFLYFEDVDLCKRIQKLGKQIIMSPEIKVSHLGGSSHCDNKSLKNHYYTSQYKYLHDNFGKHSADFIKILRKIKNR
jgi:GT2 family glycosyltransferase